MIDITGLVKFVVIIIGVLITRYLIPYIKSKTTIEQQNEIAILVKYAVDAAEQIYVGTGRGKEKKEYVLAWLNERNITFNADEIDVMIEAAVYGLKKSK